MAFIANNTSGTFVKGLTKVTVLVNVRGPDPDIIVCGDAGVFENMISSPI